MIEKFKDSLKYIKIKDILDIFIFIIMYPISIVYKTFLKINKKQIWLICELKDTANDNGYYFFKYMREKHPEVNCYYAIDKKCKAYERLESFGNIIQFGGFKHWLYYLSATVNLSNNKSGNPNAVVFYVLNVFLGFNTHRVFLQHGITINKGEWLYYKNTKFNLFICGAKKEYEYIKKNFGYPEKNIALTGFARYDTLINNEVEERSILIMPTWRSWIGRETNEFADNITFEETEYYKTYNSLINNKQLNEYVLKNDIKVYFLPHIHMQKFINSFNKCRNIEILTNKNADIQTLLNKSSMLITDYSSVSMDFAYLKKPLIYYQFDEEEYRKKQLQEGYFSYKEDGFGDVIKREDQLVEKIIEIAENKFEMELKYKNKVEKFFGTNDKKNSERIYKEIKERMLK